MKQKVSPTVFLRIILCIIILAVGVGGFILLKTMKKPPRQITASERALPVQVIRAQGVRVPIILSGYGEITSRTIVPVAAEVSGRITTTNPDLQIGAVIGKGDVLCTLDDRDYRIQETTARQRIVVLSRDLTLARKEFTRIQNLYKTKNVGALSSVENAESKVNAIANQLSVVKQAKEIAQLMIARCTIRAPFTGRITTLDVEKDAYVTPGKKLFTLVDDNDLEILVSLDSRESIRWLQLSPAKTSPGWLVAPDNTPCVISWTEQPRIQGSGKLDRIVSFDSKTRTLVAAIKVQQARKAQIPLVTGMFCKVDITGSVLDKVFLLPRQAVTFEGIVFVVKENRLHSRQVEVAGEQDGKVLITGGLEEGDTIITTRLENPLESALVRLDHNDESGS